MPNPLKPRSQRLGQMIAGSHNQSRTQATQQQGVISCQVGGGGPTNPTYPIVRYGSLLQTPAGALGSDPRAGYRCYDADGNPRWQTDQYGLTLFTNDQGEYTPPVAGTSGVVTVTFPGGSPNATAAVTHLLRVVPSAVLLTPNGVAGSAACTCWVYELNDDYFELEVVTLAGSSPTTGTTIPVAWLAIPPTVPFS